MISYIFLLTFPNYLQPGLVCVLLFFSSRFKNIIDWNSSWVSLFLWTNLCKILCIYMHFNYWKQIGNYSLCSVWFCMLSWKCTEIFWVIIPLDWLVILKLKLVLYALVLVKNYWCLYGFQLEKKCLYGSMHFLLLLLLATSIFCPNDRTMHAV